MKLFDKYFIRPFSVLAESSILVAIRNSFVLTLPLVMTGALAMLITNLPLPSFQELMVETFGNIWNDLGSFIYNGTIAIMSLVVCISICHTMAVRYNRKYPLAPHVNPLIAAIVGFACLMTMMQPDYDLILTSQWMGVSGLFISVIMSISATIIFINFSKLKIAQISFFSEEADFSIPSTISALVPALITITAFALFRGLLTIIGVHDIYQATDELIKMPFQYLSGSTFTTLIYIIVLQLLWFLGLHGANMLDSVTNEFYLTALKQNAAAFSAGEPMTHIFTKTFLDVFVFTGGAGTAICLLVAIFIFSKRGSTLKIGQISSIPALFNISELLTYGLPIVLNPFFLIPFILCPLVVGCTAYMFTAVGVLPHTYLAVPWTVPPFINAYMATGSISGPIVQMISIFMGTIIYVPFVMAYDKSKANHFHKVYQKLLNVALEGESQTSPHLMSRDDEIGAASRALANDLQRAFKNRDLYLEYQPQVSVSTGKVFGVEALLRWRHPLYGIIPPPLMIMIAEEAGMIHNVGLWLVEQSAARLAIWKEAGLHNIRMAVNVSVKQLSEASLPQKISKILATHGIKPEEFEIEVTESIALSANAAMNITLQNIHKSGVHIAIDDFGMGHSSLLYLRQFPVDVLKIDGALSRNVLSEPYSAEIIATIASMCQSLNVEMLVEFVEEEKQLEELIKLGARNFQGYLFSQPLHPDETLYFIKRINMGNAGYDTNLSAFNMVAVNQSEK